MALAPYEGNVVSAYEDERALARAQLELESDPEVVRGLQVIVKGGVEKIVRPLAAAPETHFRPSTDRGEEDGA